MTLEQAKAFYFQYKGYSFHMDREEPVKYRTFRDLGLGKDLLGKWDEELLEMCFARLEEMDAHAWIAHGDIIKIAGRGYCDAHRALSRLLSQMEKMEDLDFHTITLILENMAGRTVPMKDGGVCRIAKYKDLTGKMNEVTERLIAAGEKNGAGDDRFARAVQNYRKSYRMWTGK